jgi:hypothetical protein
VKVTVIHEVAPEWTHPPAEYVWGYLTLKRAPERDLICDGATGPWLKVWAAKDGSRLEWSYGRHWRALRGSCQGNGDTAQEAIENCDHMQRFILRQEVTPPCSSD